MISFNLCIYNSLGDLMGEVFLAWDSLETSVSILSSSH